MEDIKFDFRKTTGGKTDEILAKMTTFGITFPDPDWKDNPYLSFTAPNLKQLSRRIRQIRKHLVNYMDQSPTVESPVRFKPKPSQSRQRGVAS